MINYRIYSAKVLGREHLLTRKNCQDSFVFDFFTINDKEYVFGVICDGCSEGSNSETGATLLSNYLVSQIPVILKSSHPNLILQGEK